MPLAFSYLRYSTPRQALGDSRRRQIDQSRQYAQRHGLTLSDDTIEDLGVSAFTGDNLKTGALGSFLVAVREGYIPRDSWLLVENLDRISRDTVADATQSLLAIIGLGITVVTTMDSKVYNSASIAASSGVDLIIAITYLARGHEESRTKSTRIQAQYLAKFQAAQQTGKPITKRCPSWLTHNPNTNSFDIIDSKAQVIRDMIDWVIAGAGGRSIAKRLNDANIPLLGDESKTMWTDSHVKITLKKRAIIGEYTSKTNKHPPIPNYYPAIVPEEKYNEAWEIISTRRKQRTTRITNRVFGGKLVCTCGTNYRSQAHRQICVNSYHKGGCDAGSIEHDLLVQSFVEWVTSPTTHTLVDVPDYSAIIRAELEQRKLEAKRLKSAIPFVDDNDDLIDNLNKINKEIKQLEQDLLKSKPIRPIGIIWRNIVNLCRGWRTLQLMKKEMIQIGAKQYSEEQIKKELIPLINRAIDRIIIHKEIYYSNLRGYFFRKWEITGDVLELFHNKDKNIGWMQLPVIGTTSNSKRMSQLNKGIAIRTDDPNPADLVFEKGTRGMKIRVTPYRKDE